jgi:hypothetical protein
MSHFDPQATFSASELPPQSWRQVKRLQAVDWFVAFAYHRSAGQAR